VELFFFSSRRRHTSFSRDWSSDVCSSDLAVVRAQTCRIRAKLSYTGKAVAHAPSGRIHEKPASRRFVRAACFPSIPRGRVAKRPTAAVLKTARGASSSWVRIPPLPPTTTRLSADITAGGLFFVMSGAGARFDDGPRHQAAPQRERFQDLRTVPGWAAGSEPGARLRSRRMAPKPAHGSEAGARLRHR